MATLKETTAEWNELPSELRRSYLFRRLALLYGLILLSFVFACSLFKASPAFALIFLIAVLAAWATYEWPRRNLYKALTAKWETCKGESKCFAEVVVQQDGVLTGKDTALLCRKGNRLCVDGLRASFVLRRDLVGELFIPLKIGTERYQAFEIVPGVLVGFRQFDRFPAYAVKRGQDLSGCLAIWSRRMLSADGQQILPPLEMQRDVLFTPTGVCLRAAYLVLALWSIWFAVHHLRAPRLDNVLLTATVDHLGRPKLGPGAFTDWMLVFSILGSALVSCRWLSYSWRQYLRQKEFVAQHRAG